MKQAPEDQRPDDKNWVTGPRLGLTAVTLSRTDTTSNQSLRRLRKAEEERKENRIRNTDSRDIFIGEQISVGGGAETRMTALLPRGKRFGERVIWYSMLSHMQCDRTGNYQSTHEHGYGIHKGYCVGANFIRGEFEPWPVSHDTISCKRRRT